ncbi:MAG: S41 family peptidase [Thermomicrobiales bacterium]
MQPNPECGGGRGDGAWRWAFIAGLALLIGVTSFGVGIIAERRYFAAAPAPGMDRLAGVRQLVDVEYFGRPRTADQQAAFDGTLEDAAIQGMMQSLDGYSAFLPPVKQTQLSDQLSGQYQGIGVWVEFPNGKVTITAPMPGSPAEKAGLRAGDVIEAADGQALSGVSEDAALNLVRGPVGSTVKLTIRRVDVVEPLIVPVVRGHIPIQSVIYQRIPGTTVGLVKATVFGDKTTVELDAALGQARTDGVTGIVLDLRNNGGGWVQSAQEMIGRFVPASAGPALFEDGNPDGSDRTVEPILAGGVSMYDMPLVVLVNGGSASASEIVAGALRDYGRASIVGETSYGKGSVQRVHDFADGSSARITFAEWLTPKGNRIQGHGIPPDVAVAPGPSATNADGQLAAALDAVASAPAVASGATPQAGASPKGTPSASPTA